jgi:hypothetical protein
MSRGSAELCGTLSGVGWPVIFSATRKAFAAAISGGPH